VPGKIETGNLNDHASYLLAVSTEPKELIQGKSIGSAYCEALQGTNDRATFAGPTQIGNQRLPGCELIDKNATYPGRSHIYALFKPESMGGTNECTQEKPCRQYLRAW